MPRPAAFHPKLVALAALSLLGSIACKEESARSGGLAPESLGTKTSKVEDWAPRRPSAPTPAEAAGGASNQLPLDVEHLPAPATPEAYVTTSKTWRLGQVADIGPAAPMTATDKGVVLVSKAGRLYFGKRKGKDSFDELKAPAGDFSRYGRGPAIGQRHAYWVSPSGHLLRGHLKTGELTPLADNALPGSRVSLVRAADRELVTFVRKTGEDALAFLWAEASSGDGAGRIYQLSPEGSSATSVALVPSGQHVRAITLEGRTSMSPVHSREVRVTRRKINLLSDEVVWVGPGSHSLTELVTLDRKDHGTSALLATAQDITHFGLAQLWVSDEGGEAEEPAWRLYPNGLDPAPVRAEHLCGADWALFAVPSEAKPRAPQELRLARFDGHKLEGEEVVARSRAFNDISVAPTKNGAVVAWTADHRTWGLVLGCPPKK